MHSPFSSYQGTRALFESLDFSSLFDLTPEVEQTIFTQAKSKRFIQDSLFSYYGHALASTAKDAANLFYSLSYEDLFQQCCLLWSAVLDKYDPSSHLTFKEYCGAKYILQLSDFCKRQIQKHGFQSIATTEINAEEYEHDTFEFVVAQALLQSVVDAAEDCSNTSKQKVAKHLLSDELGSNGFLAKENRSRGWLSQNARCIREAAVDND